MAEKPTIGEWIGRIGSQVKATKSVMSPLQWAMGMILPTALAGTVWAPQEFRVWFFYTFLGTVIYFLMIYTYWTFFEPDRLHTEEHREHMTPTQRLSR